MTNRYLISTLGLTPQQHALLMDQAKQEAHRLRREAIDTFVDSLASAARSAIGALRRAVVAHRRTPASMLEGGEGACRFSGREAPTSATP
jgi:hypothetical protein